MPISNEELLGVMKNNKYTDESKNWVISVNTCRPEFVDVLFQMKDKDGKQLFDILDVCDIYDCNYMDLMKNPEKVKAVLDDEASMKHVLSYTNKGFGLRCSVKSPLPSVKNKHPELFEKKYAATAENTVAKPKRNVAFCNRERN